MKRKLTLLAVIFVLMSTGAFHSSKTEAGIFGKYGNLRPTIASEDGELIIIGKLFLISPEANKMIEFDTLNNKSRVINFPEIRESKSWYYYVDQLAN